MVDLSRLNYIFPFFINTNTFSTWKFRGEFKRQPEICRHYSTTDQKTKTPKKVTPTPVLLLFFTFLTGFDQKICTVVARKAAQAAFDVGGYERWFRKRVVTVKGAYQAVVVVVGFVAYNKA